jgi:CheY-like chemotaxis protein
VARQQRVLVVNDDAQLASSVCRLLCDEGYEARAAMDGEAALQTLADWPVDLILLDLLMPRVDGWDFLRERAQEAALTRVPVLVWSVGDAEDLERARRLGATECLPRSGCGPDHLLDSVARLVLSQVTTDD